MELGYKGSARLPSAFPPSSVVWRQYFHGQNSLNIICERYELRDYIDSKTTFPQEIWLDIKRVFHSFCASAVLWRVLELLGFYKEFDFKGIPLHLTANCIWSASSTHEMWALDSGSDAF